VKALSYASTLFMLTTISVCIIASYRIIDPELHRSTITLLIFNFLFFPLFSQLDATTFKKIFMITIGNLLGLILNIIFYYFSFFGAAHFGKAFDSFYLWIYPFFNLVWVVPFWALSLGYFAKPMQTLGKVTTN